MITSKDYIKKITTIPVKFVDELFSFYDENTMQTDFVIPLTKTSEWLKANKYELTKTLKNTYIEDKDYIITKPKDHVKKDPRSNHYKVYMLTPDCFKRLALQSHSNNAEMVRTYFIQVENMFLKYRQFTLNGLKDEVKKLTHNQRPAKNFPKGGVIYIIKVADGKTLYKIGRTNDLKNRVKNYQSGLADDVEVIFIYHTEDIVKVEKCIKLWLSDYRYRKYKEVYDVDLDTIRDVIGKCGDIGAFIKIYKNKKLADYK